jgi:hypothetical protein
MQMATDQILWLWARPSVPKRPQSELDVESYAAMFGIVLGFGVSAIMWAGIYFIVCWVRG